VSVIVKPIGRGRWSPMTLTYAGPQLAPFTCRIGERFSLGGITWRVCAIHP
jgi:hypothetical protein